jgi:hypothetical protein
MVLGGCPESRIVHFRGKGTQDFILGTFQSSLRTARWRMPTQDYVLGYSQPSLRDSILETAVLTQTLKSVLSPAFEPVGILLQDVVIRHARDVVGDHAGHTLAGELGLAGSR